MLKRANLAAVAIAAATLGFAVAKQQADPAQTLLAAAIDAPSQVSYSGVVEVVRIGDRSSEVEIYRVEHRAPNLTRRSYSAPAALAGDSMVSRGDLDFSLDPKQRRIVETRDDAASDSDGIAADYALLRENYRIVPKGRENFDGRSTIDLGLINRYSGKITMLVRIDSQNKLMLDKQEFSPSGGLIGEVRFERVSYGAIPADDFALPAGYAMARAAGSEVSLSPEGVARSAGFAVREPRRLPEGFAPLEASLTEMQGVRTVQFLYSDGIRTVSLFENATASTLDAARLTTQSVRVGARSARYTEDGSTALLAWNDGGRCYTLVGEVGSVDLTHLAAAITP